MGMDISRSMMNRLNTMGNLMPEEKVKGHSKASKFGKCWMHVRHGMQTAAVLFKNAVVNPVMRRLHSHMLRRELRALKKEVGQSSMSAEDKKSPTMLEADIAQREMLEKKLLDVLGFMQDLAPGTGYGRSKTATVIDNVLIANKRQLEADQELLKGMHEGTKPSRRHSKGGLPKKKAAPRRAARKHKSMGVEGSLPPLPPRNRRHSTGTIGTAQSKVDVTIKKKAGTKAAKKSSNRPLPQPSMKQRAALLEKQLKGQK